METLHAGRDVRTQPKEASECWTPSPDQLPQFGLNLTYSLADYLGRAIVTGRFDDKPFPVETALARRHGVSKSVTREALKMLSAKGLLTARPRQGTLVQPASSWNLFDSDVLRWLADRKLKMNLLRELNQLRAAIEPQAASLAACKWAIADLRGIEQGLRRIEAAKDGLDEPAAASVAFHVAILRATQNPFYAQFRDIVSTALQTSLRLDGNLRENLAGLREYAAVFDAIRAREPDNAQTAMRHLINETL